MEDAYTAVPFLLEVPRTPFIQELVPPRIVQHVRSASGRLLDYPDKAADSATASLLPSYQASTSEPLPVIPEMDTLHFFGVFDGHGGAEAALHCASTLHEALSEALLSGRCLGDPSTLSSAPAPAYSMRSITS